MKTTHRGTTMAARTARDRVWKTAEVPMTELERHDILQLIEALRLAERDANEQGAFETPAAVRVGDVVVLPQRRWETVLACRDLLVQSYTLAVTRATAPAAGGDR
jgi:hypothetical protein